MHNAMPIKVRIPTCKHGVHPSTPNTQGSSHLTSQNNGSSLLPHMSFSFLLVGILHPECFEVGSWKI